ncbi:MAG: sn-glycerol-3-phosphate ABC transporter ATP-binding protein UgpC [Desulfonauticus sp.]|nr:sn-glycerol-3-phosphate ABC transporter ATP-binding protein UgpC [Desulfonauticus sp.]
MASISLKGIYKYFGNTQVIQNVNLDIKHGEFVVLVGPSGCGKTTLLRIIAGLEVQSRGDVFIGEKRVNDLSPKDRNIAMVFQNYALYPHMTVEENIVFGLKLRKVPKQYQKQAVLNVAKMLDLIGLLDRKPRELSGGQRQRVAMARAIVRQPNAFLMDEPLSNLDAKLRNQMRINIKKLQRQLDTTTVYVTHDQIEAMAMADRIAVVNQGQIIQVGTPEEVYHKPANTFVANFIGSPAINFIPAVRVTENQFKVSPNLIIPFSKEKLSSFNAKECLLGIRPEHVYIVDDKVNSKKMFIWRSKILLNEPLGGETLLYTTLGDTEIKVKVIGQTQKQGSVSLGFYPEQVYIFDKKDGTCLSHADLMLV